MPELVSTMSDTKWRRLLSAIAHIKLPKSCWKFLDDEAEYTRPTPQPSEIMNGVAIGDTSAVGPFYFRDVQTLRWPAQYETTFGLHEPSRMSFQPINELVSAIEAAGQFDICVTDSGLTMYAYREIGYRTSRDKNGS